MKDYICTQKATTMEYISKCLVYEIFIGTEQIPVLIRFIRWWHQNHTQEEEVDGTSKGVEKEEG